MAFVITAPCVADYSCVEVCPVSCISPGPEHPGFQGAEQLYIDPRTCIDCGVCLDVCPVSAIFSEDDLPARWEHYAAVNRSYFDEGGEPND